MLAVAWVCVVLVAEEWEAGGGAVLSVVSSSEEQERLLVWLVSVTNLVEGREPSQGSSPNVEKKLQWFFNFFYSISPWSLSSLPSLVVRSFMEDGLFSLKSTFSPVLKLCTKDYSFLNQSFCCIPPTRRQIHVTVWPWLWWFLRLHGHSQLNAICHDTVKRCSQDEVWMVTDKKVSCNVSVIVFMDSLLIIGSRYRYSVLIG